MRCLGPKPRRRWVTNCSAQKTLVRSGGLRLFGATNAYDGVVPRNQHHPTPAERDERVKVDLPADEFIKGVVETGEHPEDEDETAE